MSEGAAKLLEDYSAGNVSLSAPTFMIYEVGNVLRKAVVKGYLSVGEAGLRRLLRLRISHVELGVEGLLRTLEYAAEAGLTYYDSAYVIAAERTKTTLLTADDVLYSKAAETAPTMHLKDY